VEFFLGLVRSPHKLRLLEFFHRACLCPRLFCCPHNAVVSFCHDFPSFAVLFPPRSFLLVCSYFLGPRPKRRFKPFFLVHSIHAEFFNLYGVVWPRDVGLSLVLLELPSVFFFCSLFFPHAVPIWVQTLCPFWSLSSVPPSREFFRLFSPAF